MFVGNISNFLAANLVSYFTPATQTTTQEKRNDTGIKVSREL